MPELPEVETIKRELTASLLGKIIVGCLVNNARVIKKPSLDLFVKKIKGSSIEAILRRGKALIFQLRQKGRKQFLVIHLRMSGQLVYPGGAKKARISFKLSDKSLLDFNDQRLLGELILVDNWQDLKFFKKMGPEPFQLNAKDFYGLLSTKKGQIKPLLLSQPFIAGIGNIYASEALFRAKINPGKSAQDISRKESDKLFQSIIWVLNQAIKHKGSSFDQYVRSSGQKGDFSRFHQVYNRKGELCCVCKGLIQRTTLAGRGTYFCPKCQK